MSTLQEKSKKLSTLRHSTAHVMAEAVVKLFPGTKVAIGPAIDYGFYYDFELPRPINNDDLPAIEKEMRKILSTHSNFEKEVISRAKALEMFKDQPFKVELINGLSDDEEISIYRSGEFTDLCRGPHVCSMADINAQGFKLMKIAGAYWRGDETKPMLTRIYGTAWEKPNDLKEYLAMLEEAEKRDHRKIGKAMDLFHIDEENPGQIFWHPKGWTLYLTVQNYVRKRVKEDGYLEVHTPFVMPRSLWERSGHWAKYKENMFITESEKRLFALKPMNCPGHVEIFKQGIKSYRDLPLRLAEFGSCTRNEPSGSLHGIMRVRGFVQDDAHIFCTEEQTSAEVSKFCELLKSMYKDFGFEEDKILVKFSTRPEQRVGDDATWDRAEKALSDACADAGLKYEIAEGEGAFYGPKLEFTLIDALGREWQCGTIQLDYQLPSAERLNAEYIGDDNNKHHPVMLHRAVIGSLERFIGILIENCAGILPPWLAPVQAVIVPVAPAFNEYAQKVQKILDEKGFRVIADIGTDRMNAKIRKHQEEKVIYQLIVGQSEMDNNSVAVRMRKGGQKVMSLDDFISFLKDKVDSFAIDAE
ncbi:threonine--tRNA ligase [Treponema putidum]|uniref:Threonine--tRNA ligase n=1 Tax=Treponema putidum TaxID=221027 RepID=A0AAE9MQF3_9SPIR|nr:threonine--tRNA ligase [Treponema putidum]AIN94128.1 threonine--tRNA ligase [Treponema putidum]TWI79583.1 threonyl-tRNA synthetase [Treponema putidum]UTY28074.1 threonine--tRNA ligase [Treponema putidum]UTY32980.1 threonine--tRNA ligase [Treponema putidum]